jgi:Na+/glutamate symporter
MIMSCMGNYFILIVHNHEMILFCHFIVTKEIGRTYLDAVIIQGYLQFSGAHCEAH